MRSRLMRNYRFFKGQAVKGLLKFQGLMKSVMPEIIPPFFWQLEAMFLVIIIIYEAV